nr:Na+/glucose cotransporter [Thermoguttaceae bacterium]
ECQGAVPLVVREVLPSGVRGIVVAGLLSALMSSLAGVFNASATLFTMDFYQKFRKNISERRLVWVGRLATFVMIVIGLLWIPVIQGKSGLYAYLQSVQGYFSPPILTVFLLGVFWKRMNSKGAMAALILGFILAILRLNVDTMATLGMEFQEGSFLWLVNSVYFQYYSVVILAVCVISMITVSLMTKAPDYEKLKGLTFGTTSSEERAESRSSWSWGDVLASVLIILGILGSYIFFSG